MRKNTSGTRGADPFPGNPVVNLRRLGRAALPYVFVWIIYYAWVVAFTTWWTASPLSVNVFDMPTREWMHAVNLISSALFIFIIQKDWFVKAARIGAAAVLFTMILAFAAPGPGLRFASALAASALIGGLNAAVLIPFVFALNNTEKLYAAVGANALIQIVSFCLEWNATPSYETALFFFLIASALAGTFFFRVEAVASPARKSPAGTKFSGRVYLTILYSCVVALLCKGVGKGLLDAEAVRLSASPMPWYYAGGLAGCALFVLIYACSDKAYLWIGNATFGAIAMGLFCYVASLNAPLFFGPSALLLGLGGTMGMINIYYIVGVVGKKYDSMRYVRLAILLIGLCGGVSGVAAGLVVGKAGAQSAALMAAAFTMAIMIAIIVTSHVVARAPYDSDWARDSLESDVDETARAPFSRYGMSARETQVCRLLLEGRTLRQISAELSIAYSTVNTYCTHVYRKVGVNSRAELMRIFSEYLRH